MNLISPSRLGPAMSRSGGLMILILAMAGCGRSDEVRVQRVPKQEPAAPAALPADHPAVGGEMPMDVHPHASGAAPQLRWTLPAGWQEKAATQIRAGSFTATGADGQTADVSITPLPSGGPEMELTALNMWRSELQLEPVEKPEAATVAIGSGEGRLFDIAGGKSVGHILAAVLERNGTSWYFKMRGDDSVVKEQKPAFVEFLKSISFDASGPSMAAADPHAGLGIAPAASSQPSADPNRPVNWQVPAGWQEVSAGQFLFAKYSVQGGGGAKADVNISTSPGDGGGPMANITRWRGQLGLPPVTEEDYSKVVRSFGPPDEHALQVDLNGTDARSGRKARLIAVIVPRAGQTWFYKLMGDEQLVELQKDAFAKFVESAKYSNAP